MLTNLKRLAILLVIIILLVAVLDLKDIARHFCPFPYRQTVEKYAQQYDLDPLLLAAIIKTESGFQPRAHSPKGARGLMQVMPRTGAWAAKNTGLDSFQPGDLYDPETNIRLGAWYVNRLLQEFNNDKVLMLAAYNGGQGNVKKWLQNKEWNQHELSISEIPFPETRKYIKKVNRNYIIYSYLYGK